MYKKIVISLFLVFISVLFVGCSKTSKKSPLVGKWTHDSYVYTFNEDNTCSYDALGTIMKCTYKVDGDKLSILYDGNSTSFDTTFKIENNKLNIKDSFGSDTIYIKTK